VFTARYGLIPYIKQIRLMHEARIEQYERNMRIKILVTPIHVVFYNLYILLLLIQALSPKYIGAKQ